MKYQLVETFFPFIPFVHGYRIVRYSKSMGSLKSPFITHQLSCIRQRFETIYQRYIQADYGYLQLEKITLNLFSMRRVPITQVPRVPFFGFVDWTLIKCGKSILLSMHYRRAFCPRRMGFGL